MSKAKKLFLILTSVVSIIGIFNSQAAPSPDPASAPITLGQWHSDLSKAIAYSDANDIPLVFVYGNLGCSVCGTFDSQLDGSTFTTWMANRQIVMVYIKNAYGSWESKWARYQQFDLFNFPYVVAYWKSKNSLGYNFQGNGMSASTAVATIESYIGDYTGADLASVEVIGPSTVMEGLTFDYSCQALDTNGKIKDVTSSATWSEDSAYASISSSGVLTVDPIDSDQQLTITATYISGGIQKSDTHQVTITDVSMAGSGTDVDPFLITTVPEFLYTTYRTADYDKHYKLMADIDLAGESFFRSVFAPNAAAGTSFSGTAFTGELDGNGFVVRNVDIATAADECFVGFFGKLDGADVHCLGIENITVAGNASSSRYVGGFCGQNEDSSVSGCYVANAVVSGSSYIGGFAGLNSYGADVDNCFALGTVTGGSNVGGFCGYNYQSSSIDSSYAACIIVTSGASGGFSALLDTGTSTIGTSFWDTEISGMTTSAGATGKTTAEMQTEATFSGAGWDFAQVWVMDQYPVLACFGATPGITTIKYSGGAGTAVSPYVLADKEDLLCLATNVPDYDKFFIMSEDIDLAGEIFDTAVIAPDLDGTNEEFDGLFFTGSFDGDGHTIDNLMIEAGSAGVGSVAVNTISVPDPSDNDCLGLFGGNNGVIKNLKINNAAILGGDDSIYIGLLCGYDSCGTISSSSVSGLINGGSEVGGMCGYLSGGTYNGCHADVDVIGDSVLGGFCGKNYCGVVSNCYAEGSVSGESIVGGFCAQNSGEIDMCYATGALDAGWDIGGFCFTNRIEDGCGMCGPPGTVYYGTVSSSFWDVETTGISTGDGATGKTTAEMQSEATFTAAGWDIGGLWYMNAYPELTTFYKDYDSGSGTEDDPYAIKTKMEFLNFVANTDDYGSYFKLKSDIDFTGESFSRAVIAPNVASGTTYTGIAFSGSFDGSGYTLSNIDITTSGSDECFLGLFGKLEGAEVSCLGVESVTITDASGTSLYVGGFCGQNHSSYINECSVNDAMVEAKQLVGGFCGLNSYGGIVSNSFAKASVTGDVYAGGFCGYNYSISSIDDSYAVGTVTCGGQKGGFSAATLDTSTVGNSFWNTDVSGLTTSFGGMGKTTAEMQTETTFTGAGWNFSDIWGMDEYPELTCFCQSSGSCAELVIVNGDGSGTYSNGVAVAISANIPDGYIFTHWSTQPTELAANVSNYLDAVTSVIVPAVEFTVTANFLERPELEPVFAGAQPNEWTMDYEAALAYAETNDLYTIFMFSGAWWCPDCSSFDEHVLQNPVWQDYINNNPVMLVMLDYDIRAVYGMPRTHPMNHCFLWDEQFLADNDLEPTEAEARLAEFHAIEEEYALPSTIASIGYPRLNYPSFVIHRPDGSRAGRMSLEQIDNPNVTNVIRRIEQAMIADLEDEMDDEALMEPTVLEIPEDEVASTPVAATLSEIDLADNYCFEAFAGSSYVFDFVENPPSASVPLMVSILGPDGLDVVDSAVIDPSAAGSSTFEGLSNGIYFVKVSLETPVTNLVGYTMSVTRDYPYSGGSGTEEDPYLIRDDATFMEMVGATADYGMYFELSADINLSGESFSRAVIAPNTASGLSYVGTAFSGGFDGNGYVIHNVNITTVGSDECFLGLFGKLDGAQVTRLGVVGVNITDASGTSQYVGGFCGQLDGSAVDQCYVDDASLDVYQLAGGFCGLNSYDSSINNCFATAGVTCNSYAAGFCGYNYSGSSIDNSYAVGTLTCAGVKGGFCAYTDGSNSAVGNSFWDTDVSGLTTSNGGTAKTTAEMQARDTFIAAGWGFISTWFMNEYPVLASCTPPGSFSRWLSDAALALTEQGEGDTPAADGIANLLKFASGLAADTPAVTSDLMYLPVEKTAGKFEVIFYRAKDIRDVRLDPLYSTSLAGPWTMDGITLTNMGEEGGREVWKASVPGADRGFIKLYAEQR